MRLMLRSTIMLCETFHFQHLSWLQKSPVLQNGINYHIACSTRFGSLVAVLIHDNFFIVLDPLQYFNVISIQEGTRASAKQDMKETIKLCSRSKKITLHNSRGQLFNRWTNFLFLVHEIFTNQSFSDACWT